MVNVGFGVETAARRFDLEFIPIARETYFFACKASVVDGSLLMSALNIMRSQSFRNIVNKLAGYDGALSGSMVTFEDTFT